MPKKIVKPKEKAKNLKTKKPQTVKKVKKIKEENSNTVDLNNILINDLSEAEYLIEKGELSLDILEDDENIYIESPVAGVKVEDINIDIEPWKILISGFRKKIKEEINRQYIHRECFYGNFSRSIILPAEIIPEKTSAKIENGMLKIALLKR